MVDYNLSNAYTAIFMRGKYDKSLYLFVYKKELLPDMHLFRPIMVCRSLILFLMFLVNKYVSGSKKLPVFLLN